MKFSEVHEQIGLPYLEWWFHKGVECHKRFHSMFLYEGFPTHWRENWRQIRGFKAHAFGLGVTFCAWRQTGVYVGNVGTAEAFEGEQKRVIEEQRGTDTSSSSDRDDQSQPRSEESTSHRTPQGEAEHRHGVGHRD